MNGVRRCAEIAWAHLDVSVRYVDVVEEADGRADVPHDLRCLWEEERRRSDTLSNPKQPPGGRGTWRKSLKLRVKERRLTLPDTSCAAHLAL